MKHGHPVQKPAALKPSPDGVFAIAITLLILEIKIPASGCSSTFYSVGQTMAFIIFLLSSASHLSGIQCGLNHHRLFSHIKRADNLLLIFNLLLLLG